MKDKIQSDVFRRLIDHLASRTDVQNIDLMILAGFCRNCLSKWYVEAAEQVGVTMSQSDARGLIYGMPYDEWKRQHQRPATPEQLAAFAALSDGSN